VLQARLADEAEWRFALKQSCAVWDGEQAMKRHDDIFTEDAKSNPDNWVPPNERLKEAHG